jgi:hypothetical protein
MQKIFIVLLEKEYYRQIISFGLKQNRNHHKETDDIISDRTRLDFVLEYFRKNPQTTYM